MSTSAYINKTHVIFNVTIIERKNTIEILKYNL